jgi:hypothetical protein
MPDPNGNGNGNGSNEDPEIDVYEPIPGTHGLLLIPGTKEGLLYTDRTEAPPEIQAIYPPDDEDVPPENSN